MVTFGPLGAVRLHSGEVVSSGFGPLDRLLPAGGVRRGSLLEWIGEDDASGALTLAFAVACRLSGVVHGAAATRASTIVVIDRLGRFHPPAVMGWLPAAASGGPEERRLVVARVSSAVDEAWAWQPFWPVRNPSTRQPCGVGSWRHVPARPWGFSCGRKQPAVNARSVGSRRGPKRGFPCHRFRGRALPRVVCGSR